MAKPKDTEIERILRKVVKETVQKGGEITVTQARALAEKELRLNDDFFKNDPEWKERSKTIIKAAFEEEDEPVTAVTATPAQSTPVEPSRSVGKEINQKPKPQERSKGAAVNATIPSETSSTTQKPATAKASKAPVAESRVGGSDESSEDEDEQGTQGDDGAQLRPPAVRTRPEITAQKANGVKRKAEVDIADATGSASESSEGARDAHKDKKTKTQSSGGSEEASSAEDEQSSEGEEDGAEDGADQTNETQPQQESQTFAAPNLKPIPAKPFKPPSGYTALDPDQLPNDSPFSPANLEGKQIWHITAPSNLPLSSITSLSLDAIQSGSPILTHNHINYILREDPAGRSDTDTLLVPTKEGYERVEQRIERTLQIQQNITLPNLTFRQASQLTGSTAAGEISQPATTTIKPQPKGLRMRYKPPGFGAGKPGRVGSGSDSMDEEEEPSPSRKATFQFPKALGAHGSSMDQIAGAAKSNADVETSTPKKAKKKRKDVERAEDSQKMVNGVSASSRADVVAPAKEADERPSSALPNGVGGEEVSKEDKARRKEEKRLKRERKEAKRKRREAD